MANLKPPLPRALRPKPKGPSEDNGRTPSGPKDILAEKGIGYVDCGVSGGVWGLDNGYCLMVGGATEAVARLAPPLETVSAGLVEVHFWLALAGTLVYVFAMWNSGMIQGLMWRTYGESGGLSYSFIDSLVAMHPYYIARAFGGRVYRFGGLEVGYPPVFLTDAGRRDPLREPLPTRPPHSLAFPLDNRGGHPPFRLHHPVEGLARTDHPQLAACALLDRGLAGLEVLDLGGERIVALLQALVLMGLLVDPLGQHRDRAPAALAQPQPILQDRQHGDQQHQQHLAAADGEPAEGVGPQGARRPGQLHLLGRGEVGWELYCAVSPESHSSKLPGATPRRGR